MKVCSTYLLIVGAMWLTFDMWLLLTVAGISNPVSMGSVLIYRVAMFIGPVTLISGTAVLLRGASPTLGVVLAMLGCVFFTGFVLYNSVIGMRRTPLQMPPLYVFYAALLVIMVLADLAAFKIWRLLVSAQMRE